MTTDLLCTIPARGGSKRVPRKNIREMAGRPLIAYSIETAKKSSLFDEVYVCTDDTEIAEQAEAQGASVPSLMPKELCGDFVPSHAPCQELARRLEEEGKPKDALVCLQPTSPLRSTDSLKKAVEKFRAERPDFLVSVTHIDPHYFHWALEEDEDGSWGLFFGDKFMKERPELPNVYRPNGSIKIADLDALAEEGNFFGDDLEVIETPPEESVHVGNEFEFDLCEALMEREKR